MDNKVEYQAELFCNRLKKKYKEYRKWSRKNRISCYRLYDRDIPEIPVSLDVYEFLPDGISSPVEVAKFLSEQNQRISNNDPSVEKEIEERRYAVIYLYERPYEKDPAEEAEWFSKMTETAAGILNIPLSHMVKKERKQQKGLNQYEKTVMPQAIQGLVQEQGQLFKIDLSTYLDTGLFFDHRPLRQIVRETVSNRRVLNLFCYTGSFSVYAAQGNASFVQSVDLSNTYLNWAKENLELNGFSDKAKYNFSKADVFSWLTAAAEHIEEEEKFDVIILDPPTFSNSKSTQTVLDINKQWPELVDLCCKLLIPNGILYFSTNSTRLTFDNKKCPKNTEITDITPQSIPKDFEGTKCHRCWKIQQF